MASNAAARRLRKELLNLEADPVAGILARPVETNILDWRFVFLGPTDTPYVNGLVCIMA
jgi:ubiquitin-protein ligase